MKKKGEGIDKNIPNVSGLVKTTVSNTKVTGLVKKTDYHTKISKIEKKQLEHDHNNDYVTTKELNSLTGENFTARLKQTNLAIKADIAD